MPQKATVTFENEEKTKKAVVSIEYTPITDETKVEIKFEPEVKADEEPEFFMQVAAGFMRDLTGQ